MQKIIFILALAMLYNSNAGAKDRDCVRYTAEEAKEAIGDSESTSFSAVFSHAAGRIGNTNTGCLASDSPYLVDDLTAVARFGNRQIILDLMSFQERMGISMGCDHPINCSYFGDYNERIQTVDWYKVNPDGGDDILQAKPECTINLTTSGPSCGKEYYLINQGEVLPSGSYYAVFVDKDNNQYRTQIMEISATQE